MWGALSDERTGMSFTINAGPRQPVILGSESRGTRKYILLSQIRDFPFRRLQTGNYVSSESQLL
jgi:hypothetical protein